MGDFAHEYSSTKSRHLWRQQINVEPYLEEADENSYLFFLNNISSQFWSHI